VFTETASGTATARPVLEQVLDQLRPGDTLVVWKLDRLGRSLRHLVDTVTGLAERGIGFRSVQEAVDTTTPGGSSSSTCPPPWPIRLCLGLPRAPLRWQGGRPSGETPARGLILDFLAR
jgi:hypothetical protein